MIALGIGAAAFTAWVVLVFLRHRFWWTRERDHFDIPNEPMRWPSVTAIVPARDEAEVIARAIGSLVAQKYPGEFRIILVDDNSSDGTAELARAAALDTNRLTVLSGAPLAPGWTGKLWAVHQGIAAAGTPDYLWLTDADIAHAPDTLRSLVTRAVRDDRVLVSLMARLRCESLAERALIPAFVWFFQMLYPFGAVNRGKTGAAAGGCMLARRDALQAAGGIAAVRDALIDDCAFGALMAKQGRVWLGLTNRSVSIRRYETWGSVGAMISRSAYAQLGYSPLLLLGTLLGLALLYLAPVLLALFGQGYARGLGLGAWGLMAIAFQPMLHFYRRSPLWGLALPVVAAFYAGATFASALAFWRGKGGMWKGRAQAAMGARA
ncbi:MAG: glycosyl transferase family 2 [Proteobacteria bacterium SG_bin5]|nr:glycosyltransferase [Sphingomonas sp.]OQW41211.1 MAG: glycosyl transferase family 2 [Proteobacteria bacterium SG_bin5]